MTPEAKPWAMRQRFTCRNLKKWTNGMKIQRKTILALAASLAFAGGMTLPLQASAQATQQAQAAPPLPAGWKVILNNDHVRVFENTFTPGVVYPMTNYPKRTAYFVKGSAPISYTYADGKTETVTQQAGVASSRERERMSVTNTGTSDAVLLVVIDKRDIPLPQ